MNITIHFESNGRSTYVLIMLPNYFIALTAALYRWIRLSQGSNKHDSEDRRSSEHEYSLNSTERFAFLSGMLLV